MDLKSIKTLVQDHSVEQLLKWADELETTGVAAFKTQEDPNEQMSDYLQAAEIRTAMDAGKPMNEAIRDFAQRVRGVLK